MASLDYQPGQILPGTVYRVERLIGVGGMGTVYDVEDTTIGKRYVVKTLHPKLGAREDLARRVMKEARTLAMRLAARKPLVYSSRAPTGYLDLRIQGTYSGSRWPRWTPAKRQLPSLAALPQPNQPLTTKGTSVHSSGMGASRKIPAETPPRRRVMATV